MSIPTTPSNSDMFSDDNGASAQYTSSGPTITRPSLFTFAPELIYIIVDKLENADLKSLRLVCKFFERLLTSRLFRVLSIKVTKTNLAKDIAKLRTLATAQPPFLGAQTLRIGPLAPDYDPEYSGPSWKYIDGEWIADPEKDDSSDVGRAAAEVKQCLSGVISSLDSLKSVEWTPHHKEDEATQQVVMNVLSALPDLENIILSIGQCKIPLPLHLLHPVRDISLVGTCETLPAHEETLDGLAKLVARSPDMNSLRISSSWICNHPIGRAQSLHQVFKYCAPNAPPLRLRHLAINVGLIRLDEITLPHLQRLTSLELTNIEDPYMRDIYIAEDDDGDRELLREQKEYGQSLEDVWKAVKNAGIALEAIVVDVVGPALLDYIASYAGLKKLVVTPRDFEDGEQSDAMAGQFFTALAKHAHSLQELEIRALFEGGWCFSAANAAMISTCRKLKALRMAIISDQLTIKPDFLRKDARKDEDVVKLFLDTVVTSLPQLEDLSIFPANLETLRGAFCGNPAMSHLAHSTRRMLESVDAYRAPSTCEQLPALIVDTGHKYDPTMDPAERRWRYVDVTPRARDCNLFYY